MDEAQIKHMVDRFLSRRLPDNFAPDGGISFKAAFNEHTAHPMKHEPTGTNLFDATQADAMVRHMIEGAPGLAWDDFRRLDAASAAYAEEFSRWRSQRLNVAHLAVEDQYLSLRSSDMDASPEPLEQIAGPSRGEEEFFRLRARAAVREAIKAATGGG